MSVLAPSTFKRSFRPSRLGVVVLLTMLRGLGLQAATLVEDFSYTADANLVGQNGGSGWNGAWAAGFGATATLKITASNLGYTSGGYSITQSGTGLMRGTHNDFRGANRLLSTSMSGSVWFTVLVESTSLNDHAGIQFNNPRASTIDYNASPFMVDLFGSSLNVYWGSTSLFTTAATGLALNSTHLVLGRMDIGAGNDTISLWVDPSDLSNPGTAQFTNNTVDMGAALTLAGVFGWGSSTTAPGSYGRLDALRISDGAGNPNAAYLAVTGVNLVPEPGKSMLLLLGIFCAAFRRRR